MGKQWQTLFSWAPKSLQMVTAAMKKDTCSLEEKNMTNLDSILKSRDITLPTKIHIVKAVFPGVMYGCESWTIKKAEHQRIDAFELMCWSRLLRVAWTADCLEGSRASSWESLLLQMERGPFHCRRVTLVACRLLILYLSLASVLLPSMEDVFQSRDFGDKEICNLSSA